MTDELIKNKVIFDRFIKEDSFMLSSFSFVSIYIWKDFFNFKFKEIDGSLCVFADNILGTFLYLPPLANSLDPQVIDKCFSIMFDINGEVGVTRIENVNSAQLSFFLEEEYIIEEKEEEFVYKKEDIINLKGNGYKSKRSDYNFFTKNNNYVVELYELSMFDSCVELYKKWANARKSKSIDDIYNTMIDESEVVHYRVMKEYVELNIVGLVVKVDNEIKAYTFGYELSNDTFCVLFEISDLEYKGISTFCFREFCSSDLMNKHTFVNVMGDFGMKNIKDTKMTFKPVQLIPSYSVRRR